MPSEMPLLPSYSVSGADYDLDGIYIASGINREGYKDIFETWIGENEGANFCIKVCNKRR